MENLLTDVSIRNLGLRTLLPEVERYLVRGGGLSIIVVYQPRKIFINFI